MSDDDVIDANLLSTLPPETIEAAMTTFGKEYPSKTTASALGAVCAALADQMVRKQPVEMTPVTVGVWAAFADKLFAEFAERSSN